MWLNCEVYELDPFKDPELKDTFKMEWTNPWRLMTGDEVEFNGQNYAVLKVRFEDNGKKTVIELAEVWKG